jgi:aminoglycoside 3-N-acetyltransferase
VPGDHVLVHAALRRVGRVLGGATTILEALRIAVGPQGTVLAYTDWDGQDDVEAYPDLRDEAPVFDPLASPAIRENGYFPEMLRTTPGASMAAIGAQAEWFTADHALDYGYGPQSPLGKLVEAGGKTLMLGAPLDTMTLLHHAEHLAQFSPKRVRRCETPMREGERTVWRRFEEFDTTAAPEGLPDDYFSTIVADFLRTGRGARGRVGDASSVLVAAKEIVPFATNWIEQRFRSAS